MYGEKGKKVFEEADKLEINILTRAKALKGSFYYEIKEIAYEFKIRLEQHISNYYHSFCDKKNDIHGK